MFKKSFCFAALATFATLSLALAANEQEITTRQGRGADASVQGGESSAKNFGTNFLWAKNGISINFSRKMYLRFDLSGATSPLANLETATLQLTMTAPNGASPADKEWSYHVWGLPDADVGENWDEKTINWDTAPFNDASSGKALKTEAVPLGNFLVTGAGKAGDTVSFTSPELAKWLQGDTNKLATLIITRDETEKSMADNVVHVFVPKEQSKLPIPTLALSFKTP